MLIFFIFSHSLAGVEYSFKKFFFKVLTNFQFIVSRIMQEKFPIVIITLVSPVNCCT